jgi:predicted  nucleic acid-binding Zn-ribbon protein
MVTTADVAQLSRECNAWRETLRSYRDEFSQLKHRLIDVASRQTTKEDLLEVEHLDNQLHIQLINIHDLKHSIKSHTRRIDSETVRGQLNEDTAAHHENLYDEYQQLEHTLKEIKQEYQDFVQTR